MIQLIQLIQAHPAAAGAVAMWLFAAVIHGMPAPEPTSGVGYRWLYATLRWCGANPLPGVAEARDAVRRKIQARRMARIARLG
jgi:hypothetical protein